MKKIVCTLAICLAFVGCKKTNPENTPGSKNVKQNYEVSFTGELKEYVPEVSGSVREYWMEGDKVLLIDHSTKKYLGSLEAVVNASDNSKAEFKGKIVEPTGNEIILAISPELNESKISLGSEVHAISCKMSYTGDRRSFMAYAAQDKKDLTADGTVPFKYATSLVKVNFDGVPAWQRIESVSMLTVPAVCQIEMDDLTVHSHTMGAITLPQNVISDNSGKYSVEVALPVCDKTDVRFILNGSLFRHSQKFSGLNFEAGKLYQKSIAIDGKYEATGKLNGVFSVSETQKVNFAKGNLRATTSDGWKHVCWDFYDHQYEINSMTEQNREADIFDWTTQAEDTEIDLFTWGCGDWSCNPAGADYYNSESSLSGGTDWGSKITIGGTWRTLSRSEWYYLFNHEGRGADLAYLSKWPVAIYFDNNDKYNFVNGIVLAPDGNTVTIQSKYYLDDVEGEPKWSQAERDYGFVFLPMAGERYPSNRVSSYSTTGVARYWSSKSYSSTKAYCVKMSCSTTLPGLIDSHQKGRGASVRLVSDIVPE